MLIKAVLFDVFDTLMLVKRNQDFYSPSLFRMYKYLNKNGVNVPFDVFEKTYIKTRDDLYAKADLNLEEPHFKVRVSETLKSLGFDCSVSSPILTQASDEFCSEFMKFISLDANTEKLLQCLHGKFKLGVVSNFAIPECVCKLLEIHGLDKLFGTVVVSAAVNKRKPSPEIFRFALKELGVSASESVFVGDTLDADVEGAQSAGMKAIYLKRRVEKATCIPEYTINSLSELPPLLECLCEN